MLGQVFQSGGYMASSVKTLYQTLVYFLEANLTTEEPDAEKPLVRICGGRRPAFGPGGPIPESVVLGVFSVYGVEKVYFQNQKQKT